MAGSDGRASRKRQGGRLQILFFAGLASLGHCSYRGFACCPGKRIHFEASTKGEEGRIGEQKKKDRGKERERDPCEDY